MTNTRRSRITLLVVLVGVITAPAIARSQEQDSASRAYAKGTKFFEERKYVQAIEAFELAYRLKPHFYVQCSIARCYENLNNVVRAAEHYRRCLDEGAAKAPMGPRMKSSLKAVEAQITRVDVVSPGKGGRVYLNGNPEGEAPRTVLLNPGSHTIEVRRTGAKSARSTIKTLGGEQRELSLVPEDLEPEVPAPATAPVTPPTDTPKEKPRRRLSQVWFWTGTAATVAFAAAAIALGVKTMKAGDAYDEDPTEEGYNTFTDYRLATNICWALTAVAAGGTTALFFYTDFGGAKAKEAEARRRLTVGFGVRGTF
jgi:hypothetical protein